MLDFDTQTQRPTGLAQLSRLEAAERRAGQLRTAFLLVASNVVGVVALIWASG